jgi:hypothetical protein
MGRTNYALERHRHAPEMNKLIVLRDGVVKGRLRAPGCLNTTEAKRHNGVYPVQSVRYASVSTEYPEPYAGLNRVVRRGRLCRTTDLKAVLRAVREQYCAPHGRELLDGSVLPVPKIRTVVCLATYEY